jgi:hypothetical protein
MIRRPPGLLGHDPVEVQLPEVERVDKGIDHAHRIAFIHPVIQAVRQQRRLIAISPLNEPLHTRPRKSRGET